MEGIIAWILEWIKPWSDITKGLFGSNVALAYIAIKVWRRGEETRKALQASQEAHAADLRKQIQLSEAHAQVFQRYAEGFQAGAQRLEPYKGSGTQRK